MGLIRLSDLPTGWVEDTMFESGEESWLDDWNDPLMVAASLAHAGEWDLDPALFVTAEAA